jgi:hypothetical protein
VDNYVVFARLRASAVQMPVHHQSLESKISRMELGRVNFKERDVVDLLPTMASAAKLNGKT